MTTNKVFMIILLMMFGYVHGAMAKLPLKFEDANYTALFIVAIIVTVTILHFTKD